MLLCIGAVLALSACSQQGTADRQAVRQVRGFPEYTRDELEFRTKGPTPSLDATDPEAIRSVVEDMYSGKVLDVRSDDGDIVVAATYLYTAQVGGGFMESVATARICVDFTITPAGAVSLGSAECPDEFTREQSGVIIADF